MTFAWPHLFWLLLVPGALLVAEIAKRRSVHLSFGEYLKAGTPIAILTLILGVAWLSW